MSQKSRQASAPAVLRDHVRPVSGAFRAQGNNAIITRDDRGPGGSSGLMVASSRMVTHILF